MGFRLVGVCVSDISDGDCACELCGKHLCMMMCVSLRVYFF